MKMHILTVNGVEKGRYTSEYKAMNGMNILQRELIVKGACCDWANDRTSMYTTEHGTVMISVNEAEV